MKNERLAELERAVSTVDEINEKNLKKRRQEENAAAAARRECNRQMKSLQELSSSIESAVNGAAKKQLSKSTEKRCRFTEFYMYGHDLFDVDAKYSKAVDVKLNNSLTVTLGLAEKDSVYEKHYYYPKNEIFSFNIRTIIDVKSSQTGISVATFFIGDEGIISISIPVQPLGSNDYRGQFYKLGESGFEEQFEKAKEIADEVL